MRSVRSVKGIPLASLWIKIFHLQLNATVVSPLRGLLLLHSRSHFLRFQAQSSHAPESRQGRLQTEHVSIYI